MVTCNTTLTDADIHETPLFGKVIFHHVGLVISALFALISAIIAFFLMQKHATHYSKPWEQKHIIRIVLMLPIYSTVSFLSYLYYQHAIYFEVVRDCYEAFAIASFFTLLCHYIAPNLHEQKDYFRQLTPINWFWAVFGLQKCTGGQDRGILRRPKSGLTWFNVVWVGVFQYCFIRVLFTIVSVISQAFGRYCESSLNPEFAHVWVMVIEGAAVTVAMFFLIQFYLQLKTDLAEHKPFLKVLCIKLVIFFSFWQSLLISFLTSTGAIAASDTLASQDINIGIPSMLLCIEMAIFAIMHLFAFPWREYDLSNPTYMDPTTAPGSGYSGAKPEYKGGALGIKAWMDAFNPWDIIKASARGFRWLFVGRRYRHHDVSYKTDSIGGVSASPIDAPGTSIPGPNVTTQTMPSATELQGRGRSDTGEHFDDRARLLSHAQGVNLGVHQSPSPSPSRQGSYDEREEALGLVDRQDGAGDVGMGRAGGGQMPFSAQGAYQHYPPQPRGVVPGSAVPMPAPGGVPWDQDTEYRSATGGAGAGGAGRGNGAGREEWDHWAGARRD